MKWRQLLLFTAVRAVRVAHGQTLEDVLTSQAATLSTLNAWLLSEDLIFQIMSNAQGITLLAPSNNAINQLYTTALATQLASDPNLLTAFLSYHVLNGVYQMSDFTSNRLGSVPTFMNMHGYSNVSGGQTIETLSENGAVTFITGNGAETNVETYDFNYSGGTLHIIDSVLTIPGSVTDTLLSGGRTAALGALRRAGIEDALNAASDVTIFVPTNDAFNAIGSTVNSMTLEQLTQVLNYHVIQGKVLYSQLISGGSEATREGNSVNFRLGNGELFVNSARVVDTDILVGNGVVHVVDNVLNPSNTTATPVTSASTQAPAFDGATTTTGGVPFTSAVVTTTTTSTSTHTGTATTTASPTGDSGSGGEPPGDVSPASRVNLVFTVLVLATSLALFFQECKGLVEQAPDVQVAVGAATVCVGVLSAAVGYAVQFKV